MYATAVAGDAGVIVRTCVQGPMPTGGGRGEICGFSQGSRRRLVERLMMFPWAEYGSQGRHDVEAALVLVTLTYPGEYPEDCATVKCHLDNLHRALVHTKVPLVAALWRLEYQKRGAPHFHIVMLFGRCVRITAMENWVKRTWARIVGSGDVAHVEHGADVRPVAVNARRPSRLMVYLVKYLGKLSTESFHTGRIWGCWGDWPQVIRAAVTFESRAGYVEFLRRVRRWGRRSRYLRCLREVSGLRLYAPGPAFVGSVCRELPGCDVYFA